ncbi:MAG TPA: flagellar biosynthetic protein FliR [Polyangia bacterium]|nr:flagellar biosynthetic protein FliR [Polyangia bacterium]
MSPAGVAGLPALVLAVALGAARATPIVWMVAPLGGVRLAAPARVGLALLLAALAAPLLSASPGAAALAGASAVRLALAFGRKVLVGFCLGFVAAAAFRAAEMAGRLGDTLRGANVAEILVPTTEERSSPLGVLYLLLATLVFLQIGGVARLTAALLDSYRVLPVGGGLDAGAVHRAAAVVTISSARLIAAGVALAAPIIVALWLTDLALGLIARAAPQVPVYFVGLPLKGLLAIGLVLLTVGTLQATLAGDFGIWLALVRRTTVAF